MNKSPFQHTNNKSPLHLTHEYPFYRTYIDIECRKDILVENEHMNKKVRSIITPFFTKATKKIKQNKLRLTFFFSFIILFKLQPVYDYFFCNNTYIDWFYNNIINYYTDCTKQIPNSITQLSRVKKLVNNNQTNKTLAELYYHLDKNPNIAIGYNHQRKVTNFITIIRQRFVNDPLHEVSMQQFIEICGKKYKDNIIQVETQLNNLSHNISNMSIIL